jgi:tetratricopeptide (TPR) repeat protein
MRRHISMLVPVFALAAGDVSAEDDAVAQCGSAAPEIAIRACTSLIDGGGAGSDALPKILAQRAKAHARKYDYDRAIKDYNHAIKLRPNDVAALDGRGLAHANRLNFELAIKDYDQSIKLRPDNAKAFYRRGLAKFGISDIDGADADIAKARALDPSIGDRASVE